MLVKAIALSVWTTARTGSFAVPRATLNSVPQKETDIMIPAQSPKGSADCFAAENYWRQLHPWCVVRLLPNVQRIVIQRFRQRNQAEEYVKVLRQLVPTATHQIVFDLENWVTAVPSELRSALIALSMNYGCHWRRDWGLQRYNDYLDFQFFRNSNFLEILSFYSDQPSPKD